MNGLIYLLCIRISKFRIPPPRRSHAGPPFLTFHSAKLFDSFQGWLAGADGKCDTFSGGVLAGKLYSIVL